MMNEVLEFLKECGTFYLSTVEGDQPRVRPFGFVIEHDGKLCYCTSNKKPVYAQLKTNPKAEISATAKDSRWIRISGNAVFCTSRELKVKALEAAPFLRNMYSEDDDKFELFYLDDGIATISAFNGENKTINL